MPCWALLGLGSPARTNAAIVLFRGSIGRTHFPRGDHDTLICSNRQQLWPLGDGMCARPWADVELRA
jgi:hypothetical protein